MPAGRAGSPQEDTILAEPRRPAEIREIPGAGRWRTAAARATIERMVTLEQRHDRAVRRHARALVTVRRSRHAVDRSRWLLSSSRVVLDRPDRLIRGGAPAPDGLPSEAVTRDRIRTLMRAGMLPTLSPHYISASNSRDGHGCVACSTAIPVGEREFAVSNPAVILHFHRRCMELWASEAQAQDAQRLQG
jgi:hypothetical protein